MAVLGELEHKVMRVLWAGRGPMSVRAVHDVVDTERPLAYTTVMTVMDRLAKKGVLVREQHGRAWEYLPVQSQAAMVADEMASLLEDAGDEAMRTVGEFVSRLTPDLAEHARLCLGMKPGR